MFSPSLSGHAEFAADFEAVESFPETALPSEARNRDLGWMLYDIDYGNNRSSAFFHAVMEDGIIDVGSAARKGLAS